jgi:signal transduction histidine kinase
MQTTDLKGLQVTYSISIYPETAETLQQLITIAEERLFQAQRSKWIKNEEEIYRSERLRAVGELAAGMAHEIRNPLTAIRGFLQLSRGQAYNIAPWYEVIMGEVIRVTDLTAEFLQFSKPQAHLMKPERLGHCLERVLSLTESDAASRGHRISLELTGHAVMVHMDRDKIVQVLINLIRNAFEAMNDPGEVHIVLVHEGDKAYTSITDTGSGIPEKALADIFNPFYTTKEEGTGLGLSLCQKIAHDHHGEITVRSEVGIGSMFTLELPVVAVE